MNDITAYNSIMLHGDFQNFGYNGYNQGFPFMPIFYTSPSIAITLTRMLMGVGV